MYFPPTLMPPAVKPGASKTATVKAVKPIERKEDDPLVTIDLRILPKTATFPGIGRKEGNTFIFESDRNPNNQPCIRITRDKDNPKTVIMKYSIYQDYKEKGITKRRRVEYRFILGDVVREARDFDYSGKSGMMTPGSIETVRYRYTIMDHKTNKFISESDRKLNVLAEVPFGRSHSTKEFYLDLTKKKAQ